MNADTVFRFSCPSCRSPRVSRARYDSIFEQALLRLVAVCPFVCHSCDLRFFLFLAASRVRRLSLGTSWPRARYKPALPTN